VARSQQRTIGGERYQRLIAPRNVEQRKLAVAKRIAKDYVGKKIRMIEIAMAGSFLATDLSRLIDGIDPDIQIVHDLARLSTTMVGRGGIIKPKADPDPPRPGENIMIVDTVASSGMSLRLVTDRLMRHPDEDVPPPASLAVVSLVVKPDQHHWPSETMVDYAGFVIYGSPSLAGEGMDAAGGVGRGVRGIWQRTGPGDSLAERIVIPEL
jgi:hypoxanthine-guanine phosphoribosyltransferase